MGMYYVRKDVLKSRDLSLLQKMLLTKFSQIYYGLGGIKFNVNYSSLAELFGVNEGTVKWAVIHFAQGDYLNYVAIGKNGASIDLNQEYINSMFPDFLRINPHAARKYEALEKINTNGTEEEKTFNN